MTSQSGPSTLSLLWRAMVLSTLIAEVAWIYLRVVLGRRGVFPFDDASFDARCARFAARFVRVASEFRGGLIKLGQVASLRVDVLPDSVTNELVRLQDQVPGQPYAEIASQVEHELGAVPERLFRSVDRAPLAAASLGQVHRAVDRGGREVVLKVLYPGVERSVAVDLRMAKFAITLFNPLSTADLTSVYDQIAASIRGEMDYVREGKAAEEVARNLDAAPEFEGHIRVPRIDWRTTSRRVLTMEYIDGDKINDREALESRGVVVDEVVAWATKAFLHMMFRNYFFHCDPHPGNLLVDQEGRVAIIDFGMNERIETEIMDGVRKNVLAAVTRNEDLWVESMIQIGIISDEDRVVARQLAQMSFDPTYYNLTPKELTELDFTDYFMKMRSQLSNVRSFSLPAGLVGWGRAFSLLYGLALELAPGMRPLEVVGPYVLGFLQPPPADPVPEN